MLSSDSCSQNYTGGGAVVQFTKGERPFSIRQNADTPATTSAQGGGLAAYERDYLAGLLASFPVRSLADLIIVRDGVAAIRADIPLHALSLENACTLQGLAGGGSLPIPAEAVTSAPARSVKNAAPAKQLPPLTDRQRRVLELLCAGMSNREIAATLGTLTEATVKIHVSAVLKALGALNRTHAVMIAQSLGHSSQLHGEQLAHAGGHDHQFLADRRVQPGQPEQHVDDAVSGVAVGVQLRGEV